MGKKGGRKMLRKAVVVLAVLVVFGLVLCDLLVWFAILSADHVFNHRTYHYHSGWQGMEVRHSYAISCEEADRWAPVAQKIWGDILAENPSLADPGFTFSAVADGELGPGAAGWFAINVFRPRHLPVPVVEWITISVVVKGSGGKARDEVLVVGSLTHELEHFRWYLEKGTTEECYPSAGNFENPEEFEEYAHNVCEQVARDFVSRYLREHLGEILEILEED